GARRISVERAASGRPREPSGARRRSASARRTYLPGEQLQHRLAAGGEFDGPAPRRVAGRRRGDPEGLPDRPGHVPRADPGGGLPGRSLTDAPILSVARRTMPGLTPPPASTIENACGQWSRPAIVLIRGVRPNSVVSTTSVESSRPRSRRSAIRAANPRSRAG